MMKFLFDLLFQLLVPFDQFGNMRLQSHALPSFDLMWVTGQV